MLSITGSLYIETVGQTLSCCWRVLNRGVKQGTSTPQHSNLWVERKGKAQNCAISNEDFWFSIHFLVFNSNAQLPVSEQHFNLKSRQTQPRKSQLSLYHLSRSWNFPMATEASVLHTFSLEGSAQSGSLPVSGIPLISGILAPSLVLTAFQFMCADPNIPQIWMSHIQKLRTQTCGETAGFREPSGNPRR